MEKKKALLNVWNSIPRELCVRLIDNFDKRIKWVSENTGERYFELVHKSSRLIGDEYEWSF